MTEPIRDPFSYTDEEMLEIDNIIEEKQRYNTSGLIPWKPGQSGNPRGRPKNSVTTLLRETPIEDRRAIATKLVELAKNGDLKAIDMFVDRTDGKIRDDTGGQDNRQINFILSGEQSQGLIDGIRERLSGKLLDGGYDNEC